MSNVDVDSVPDLSASTDDGVGRRWSRGVMPWRRRVRRPRSRFMRWVVRARRCVVLLVVLFVGELIWDWWDPYPVHLLDRFPESQRVVAKDGTPLRVVPTKDGERRIHLTLEEMSPWIARAVIVSEDRRFYGHAGVDWLACVRAAGTSTMRGHVVSGASTLHMQLARIAEPHSRTLLGKLWEIRRARQLARELDHAEVLEAYLNLVPLGGTLRGFPAASWFWFGKSARDLAPEEAATLVAMLPAPTRRAPDRAPKQLRRHRDKVIDGLRDAGHLTPQAWRRSRAAPLGARRHGWPFRASHACDLLLRAKPGVAKIENHLDIELQAMAEHIVRTGVDGGADGVALVVLERTSREPAALVGSRDWHESQLNAAVCRRCAGSTLKPFIYALAMEAGVTGPDRLVADTPVTLRDYAPANFDRTWSGPVRTAEALRRSRNAPAVRLLRAVGVDRFRDLLTALGITVNPGSLHLDAALGTLDVSPLELACAYARFADPEAKLPGASASIRARVLALLRETTPDPATTGRPVAWKTGTSSGRRDAWCVGVTDHHVTVAWLGNLKGRGAANLVGSETAARLVARMAARLP